MLLLLWMLRQWEPLQRGWGIIPNQMGTGFNSGADHHMAGSVLRVLSATQLAVL